MNPQHEAEIHPVKAFLIVSAAIWLPLFLAFALMKPGQALPPARQLALAAGGPAAEATAVAPMAQGGVSEAGQAAAPELPSPPASEPAALPGPEPGPALAEPAAAAPAWYAPPPLVNAEAYVLVERGCGQVIAGKNENLRLPPASLTKIVTAMVVRKQDRLNDVVTVNVSGKRMAASGSSVMGLEPSMRVSVRDLLYGLFLPSGNDAALALAQYTSGDVNHFVELMNQTAQELQLHGTHFTNPHGLDNPGLYSTALDMANAGRALLDDPVLAKISSTTDYTGTWPGPTLKNGNRLLKTFPGAYGVKIGYTENAHQTIVAAAERNGRQIVLTILKSDDRYAESTALLQWAFDSTTPLC